MTSFKETYTSDHKNKVYLARHMRVSTDRLVISSKAVTAFLKLRM